MRKSKRKVYLILLLSAVLCLFMTVPAAAKTKGYVKAYRKILEKGTYSITSRYKYTGEDGKVFTETPFTTDYDITGFYMLNIDRKGSPELILQLKEAGSDEKRACVFTYKKGRAMLLQLWESANSTFVFGKEAYHVDKNGKSDYDAQKKKNNDFFYYSKSQKALYWEYTYDDNCMYDLNGKKYSDKDIIKCFYSVKGTNLIKKRYARKYVNDRGYHYYEICNNQKTRVVSYHNSKLYSKYNKKYFKVVEKYNYRKPISGNIRKYIR